MAAMSVFAVLLAQMDKLVLSKLMPLEAFGHYVLAATIAGGLQLFVVPLYTALFPQLSSLVAVRDEASIRGLYHHSTQLLSVMAIPCAAVLVLFPREVLEVWTGDASTSARAAPLLALLAVGTALNGLMHVPYALQLAYGWTRIGVVLTLAQLLLFFPLLVGGVVRFGAPAAAAIWALTNVFYLSAGISWTHRRLLVGEARAWLSRDVGFPGLAAVTVSIAGRLIMPEGLGRPGTGVYLLTITAAAATAALAAAPRARAGMRNGTRSKEVLT
jgi:O-antigen/teichoic acid export membrane protein